MKVQRRGRFQKRNSRADSLSGSSCSDSSRCPPAGVGLQVLQQACGINTVMYFLVSILTLAGISDNRTALLIAMGPAAVNAAGTVLGMLLIDRSGRRCRSKL